MAFRATGERLNEIFFSYTVEDLDRVKTLVKALEEVGWSVWWDRSMLPGSRWQRTLREAIGAAKCVIVAWSYTSIDSEWVEVEAEEGRRRGILVPVLIDDVVPPFPFGGIQAARLLDWTGLVADREFESLTQAVRNVLARSSPGRTTGSEGQIAAKVAEAQREKADAARKVEEERIAREKADAARKVEEERIAREKADAARNAEEERIAREKADAARNAERERIAREKADAARKAEKERIAREKADAAHKAEKERIACERADAARKAEKERIAQETFRAPIPARYKIANCQACGAEIHPESTDCPFCGQKYPLRPVTPAVPAALPLARPHIGSRAYCHNCRHEIHPESTDCPFCGQRSPLTEVQASPEFTRSVAAAPSLSRTNPESRAYCNNCGNEIHPQSTDCPFCGQTDPFNGRRAFA
jgi:uncharacterized OB-fold protein